MRIDVKGHVFYFFHKHYTRTTGIRSTCADGKHIVMMDFDNTPLCRVMAICRMVQNIMNAGTFHVFESSPKSYHAICIDKFPHHLILAMQDFMGCDDGFMISGIKRRYWTLRTEAKLHKRAPKYLLSLKRESNRERSTAHAKFLNLKHGLSLNGTDDNSNILFDNYAARRD